jgi:cytochrome oxidase Cu insertion factor (SCO1/SenC/PrrC family)
VIALLFAVATIHIVDDSGRTRSVDEWRGAPTIVVPMYTRCPLACPAIAENLKRATQDMDPNSFRVVFFSFDPRDTTADLRAFRERHRLPLAWTLANASAGETRALLDSLDYRVSDVMSHPNAVIVLTRDLQTSRTFNASSVSDALAFARGGSDLLGRFGGAALAVALLMCTLSAILLFR